MNVSLFKGVTQYIGDTTTENVIHRIKTGEEEKLVNELRKLKLAGDEEIYSKFKKRLPSFTVSGTFENGHKQKDLKSYNGNIVIDIDDLPPELFREAECKIKLHPYTHAVFTSPSGTGLKIIIKTNSTPEKHKENFKILSDYIGTLLNVFTDESGSDFSRLCFFSSDPNALYISNSTIFDPLNLLKMKQVTEIKNPDAQFEHCKRYTDKKMIYAERNRNNYIYLLANNCNRKGLTEEQCIYYSCETFDLPADEIKSTVKSAYKNEPEKPKENIKRDKILNIDRIETFLSEKYDFRYNVVVGNLEFKIKENMEFLPMTDYIENSQFRELAKAGINCNQTKLRAILCSDFCTEFDPFAAYFNNLQKWDGVTDYISELASTVTTTKQELWVEYFKKWMVAMVAGVVNPKIINHTGIVFAGGQGIGKTTWMERLVPNSLKNHLFTGTINPADKDTLVHLVECMLINLDELENLNKSEIGSLKEIMTKTFVKFRRVYARNNVRLPRRASFCGNVNKMQFLNDITGSRRFLCFEVIGINYLHDINIDYVLSQALSLYEVGFQFWFSKDEIESINANNEQFQLQSFEEEMLLIHFTKPTNKHEILYLTASEIASKIGEKAKINVNSTNAITIGKLLTKHNFKRVKKRKLWVYEIWELNREEVDGKTKEPPNLDEADKVMEDPKADEELPF